VRVGPVLVAGTTGSLGAVLAAAPTPRPEQGRARQDRDRPHGRRCRLDQVARTRIFVTDIRTSRRSRARAERFGDVRPASTLVEVTRLVAPDLVVEIEADAYVEEHEHGQPEGEARAGSGHIPGSSASSTGSTSSS
jgi:hypothetical protein